MDKNTYIHICYKVDIKLLLAMEVPWNKITSNNFSYFHDFIPKKMGGKEQLP
jgi:hypothetical protein